MTESAITDFIEIEEISLNLNKDKQENIFKLKSPLLNPNKFQEDISEIIYNNIDNDNLDRRNSSFEEINSQLFINNNKLNKITKHKHSNSINTSFKGLNSITERSKVNERKTLEEQILILELRIKKLKDQEVQLNKSNINVQNKYKKEESTKIKKEKNKEELQKVRLERNELLVKQKSKIEKAKKERKINLFKAQEDLKLKNKKNFDIARTDKVIMNTLSSQFTSHYTNVNNYKYLKEKEKKINSKTEKIKKIKEKEEKDKSIYISKIENETLSNKRLFKQLEHLEKIENLCLEKLKSTKINNNLNLSNIKINTIEPFNLKNKTTTKFKQNLTPNTQRSITPIKSIRSHSTNETEKF